MNCLKNIPLKYEALLSNKGVIQVRALISNAEQIVDFIAEALLRNTEELKKGAILTVDTKKARIRLLPL